MSQLEARQAERVYSPFPSLYPVQALNGLDAAHHMQEGNLLHSVNHSHVNLTQNDPHRHPGNTVGSNIWASHGQPS